MRENVISFFIVVGILTFVGILWYAYENPVLNPRLETETYTILRKWDMPEDLEEISGIQYLSKDRIACIQDEEGIIYIYNLNTNLVEKRINFAKAGDYEGIAISSSTAYIIESNGLLYQVAHYMDSTFTTEIIKTPFSGRNNMESLTLDEKNNRLLMAVKDKDPNGKSFKGIYPFDLDTKKTSLTPVLKIPLDDPIFKSSKGKGKKSDSFYPSDLAINPIDGNIYVLEGKNPQLLIMDWKGKLLRLHKLYEKSFPQPEGITFAPDGTLYISNEGRKGEANILEVELKDE